MVHNSEQTGDKADLNERELIERCRSGEELAYEEFYWEFSARVYTLAYKMLMDPEAAKDATQEVFVKAFRGLKNFQYQSKIGTWIYRITVNHCRDMQRSKSRRKEVSVDSMRTDEQTESMLEKVADTRPNPGKELRLKIIAAINRLPDEFRETIFLKEIEDQSYEEIAKIIGCRMGTVKSRIFRARELLQIELRDLYKEITSGEER
jgi:RNA polymerase sigma-70 factor (ECF subfamily)